VTFAVAEVRGSIRASVR